jgi:hypothetical protein
MSGRGRVVASRFRRFEEDTMSTSWVQVQGSTPHRPAGAARIDEIDPDQQLNVTVAVRVGTWRVSTRRFAPSTRVRRGDGVDGRPVIVVCGRRRLRSALTCWKS